MYVHNVDIVGTNRNFITLIHFKRSLALTNFAASWPDVVSFP